MFSAQIARDSNGESKGYGYVHYLSSSSYTNALDEYTEGIEIAGRLSKATAADDKRKIYVRNLPRDMDEKQVQAEIEAITGKSDSFNLSGKGGQNTNTHTTRTSLFPNLFFSSVIAREI